MWKPASPYNNLPELPPPFRETAKIFRQTTQSRVALERLHQTVRLLPEKEIFVQIIPVLEAQASSEIENIAAATDNLFKYLDADSQADDAAKEAQGMLEMKISQLKDLVANARFIDESKLNTHTVQILNTVKIKNVKNGAVMTYTIVSESEANLREGKISATTPIAKGLLGKKVGDIAEIQVPSGLMSFEIVDISI